ncbi:MAG: hypothetical protein AAFX85_10105, partial [Pseudomonadota bacterium]
TLARCLGETLGVVPIDLDGVYWEPDAPGVARPLETACADLCAQVTGGDAWVVEGCYEELAQTLFDFTPTLLWLDPGEAICLEHCRRRPWEPHKYPTPQAQDANLAMLLEWVQHHYTREGALSYAAHRALFDAYDGPKHHLRRTYSVEELQRLLESAA